MDARSLQDVNSEFLSKRQKKKKFQLQIRADGIVFWVSVALIIIALLSFNYKSFLTRPVFGYSLYLTEGDKNLMLVKNAGDFDPKLTAETVYKTDAGLAAGICGNNHETVEIGIVTASYPRLGRLMSFIIDKAYIPLIIAFGWVAMTMLAEARQRIPARGHGRFARRTGQEVVE